MEGSGYRLQLCKQIYYIYETRQWTGLSISVFKDEKVLVKMEADLSNYPDLETLQSKYKGPNWKLMYGDDELPRGNTNSTHLTFNDKDGNAVFALKDNIVEITMCHSREETIVIQVNIELTSDEYEQFTNELRKSFA